MPLWELLCVIGVGFVILEIFTPSMFFLNFALASFITALASVYIANKFALVLIFFVLSFLSFAFLRPVIMKKNTKETKTGIEDKYIGRVAKVVEEVSEYKGVISIYDERWEARSDDKSIIPAGAEVKIIRNESLIMYVTKLEN